MRDSIILNLRAVWARAYVRIVGANREPSWIIAETLLPLFSLSAYVFLYKAIDAPAQFIGFVILGGTMTAYWIAILWGMAAQFYWEKTSGQFALYLIAPMSRMAILMGMAVGGFFMTTIRAVATLIIGCLIFRVEFQVVSWVYLILIFLLSMVALYGMGMMFASLFLLWGREVQHLTNLLQEPIYLFSGFYFPVKCLGTWVSSFASLIPLTLGLDGMRQCLFGQAKAMGFMSFKLEVLILLGMDIVFLYLAGKMHRIMEYKGKKEGTLTTRWQ
ncbi:MAG: ABC transporter permease [Candidatus Stahlbacteria bacterium]|nr:ABC transporter permease [Candidatus Stahlbacteria bacterium]